MIFRQAHFRDKQAPVGVGVTIFKRGIVQAVDQNGVFNFNSFIKPFKGHTNALETTPLTKILDFLLWCSRLWRDKHPTQVCSKETKVFLTNYFTAKKRLRFYCIELTNIIDTS